MQSFKVNREVLSKYKALNEDVDIKYGILAASGAVPAIYTGIAFADKVVSVDFTNRNYDIMEMKVYGITSDTASTELYCCGYILVDGAITYMDEKADENGAPAKVTYTSLGGTFVQETSIEATLPSSKEEIL